MQNNTGGYNNTAYGYQALQSNTTGGDNTAAGTSALQNNTTGIFNAAMGQFALVSNTTGGANVASGVNALQFNTTGNYNTAIGHLALENNTMGSNNTAIGFEAADAVSGGNSNNIEIGSQGAAGDSGAIRIGTPGTQTSFFAAGVNGVGVSGASVVVSSSGQLGVVLSSERFKEDIRDMGEASSGLMRLRPVTFRYKQAYGDGSKPMDYGLIAEEVAQVYPDLAVKGADGQVETVQYQKLTPMLLNELQKQSLQIQGQSAEIQTQSELIRALEARLAALEAQR